jgi:hypothetical protein
MKPDSSETQLARYRSKIIFFNAAPLLMTLPCPDHSADKYFSFDFIPLGCYYFRYCSKRAGYSEAANWYDEKMV